MTSRVESDNRVAIPDEIVRELGLHEGSVVEWTRTPDGGLTLHPAPSRSELARRLLGAGQGDLAPG